MRLTLIILVAFALAIIWASHSLYRTKLRAHQENSLADIAARTNETLLKNAVACSTLETARLELALRSRRW